MVDQFKPTFGPGLSVESICSVLIALDTLSQVASDSGIQHNDSDSVCLKPILLDRGGWFPFILLGGLFPFPIRLACEISY